MKFIARCTVHRVSLKANKWISANVTRSTYKEEPCWELSMGGFYCPAENESNKGCSHNENNWEFVPIDEYEMCTTTEKI